MMIGDVYEIKVQGKLDDSHWSQWFDGMTVTVEERGETVIRGPVADQAALFGLLAKVRDLALPLLSVQRVDCNQIKPDRIKEV
jgi:hypothetical protein